jgi:hypothetical protein
MAQAAAATEAKMNLLKRLRGRGRYFLERGDHWFLLSILAFAVLVAAVVLLY